MDDLDALKPTIFVGVPRVFDRIRSGALEKVRLAIIIIITIACHNNITTVVVVSFSFVNFCSGILFRRLHSKIVLLKR